MCLAPAKRVIQYQRSACVVSKEVRSGRGVVLDAWYGASGTLRNPCSRYISSYVLTSARPRLTSAMWTIAPHRRSIAGTWRNGTTSPRRHSITTPQRHSPTAPRRHVVAHRGTHRHIAASRRAARHKQHCGPKHATMLITRNASWYCQSIAGSAPNRRYQKERAAVVRRMRLRIVGVV